MNDQLKNGAPTGSLVANNESGWMDRDMFLVWFGHFAVTVKPSIENNVLIVLDAVSHTRSLAAIEFARENGSYYLIASSYHSQTSALRHCFFEAPPNILRKRAGNVA